MRKKIIFNFVAAIFVFIIPLSLDAQDRERIYLIQVNYDRGSVSFGEVSTKMGYVPGLEKTETMSENQYRIELVSFKGQVLEEKLFSIHLEIGTPPPLPGEEPTQAGPVILEKTQHLVIFPYHNDGKTLNLYDVSKNLLAKRDVGFLADVCGDGTCQDHESFDDCPKDCPAAGKDDFCNKEKYDEDPDCPKVAVNICNNDGICTGEENIKNCPSDCTQAKEAATNKTRIIILAVISVIIIVVIIAAYYFLIRKKEENIEV